MRDRSQAQQLTMLLGVVFLLVGILGFIPGITTHYGDMSFAGDDSGAKLIGIFQVSILHNLVHILFGIAVNNGDNWLHLALGVGMIGLGVVTTRAPFTRMASQP